MKRTSRGFGIYTEFVDTYGSHIRVQKSSAAGLRRCWIFCAAATPNKDMVPHLSPAQARKVAAALLRFADGKE